MSFLTPEASWLRTLLSCMGIHWLLCCSFSSPPAHSGNTFCPLRLSARLLTYTATELQVLITSLFFDVLLVWASSLKQNMTDMLTCTHKHYFLGKSAEMILIGYDGIAFSPILFPHQPSLFMFLECLENSLLPQGCLEPPLWYIKTHATKVSQLILSTHHTTYM